MVLERKVYNQCILPTVTYGSETCYHRKKQNHKIRTIYRAHERVMLNITWKDKKTALWIRKQTGVRDIIEDIRKSKWTWAGHIVRMDVCCGPRDSQNGLLVYTIECVVDRRRHVRTT